MLNNVIIKRLVVFVYTILFYMISSSNSHALQDNINCFDITQKNFWRYISEQVGKLVYTHQLKKHNQAWYLIFTEVDANGKLPINGRWLISERSGKDEPQYYCILGEGNQVLPLASPHNSSFPEKFGLPGTGNPRCGNPEDPLEGLKVRAWASRELGESIIFYFERPNNKDTIFGLVFRPSEGYWILLSKEENEGTCYKDRGDQSDHRLTDFTKWLGLK